MNENNLTVQSELKKDVIEVDNKVIKIIDNKSLIVDGEIKESNNLINKVIFLSSYKMFIKVEKVIKETDLSSSKVTSTIFYEPAQLNETFSKLKIDEKNIINDEKITPIFMPTIEPVIVERPVVEDDFDMKISQKLIKERMMKNDDQ